MHPGPLLFTCCFVLSQRLGRKLSWSPPLSLSPTWVPGTACITAALGEHCHSRWFCCLSLIRPLAICFQFPLKIPVFLCLALCCPPSLINGPTGSCFNLFFIHFQAIFWNLHRLFFYCLAFVDLPISKDYVYLKEQRWDNEAFSEESY